MSVCEKLLSIHNEKRSVYLAFFGGMVLGAAVLFLAGVIFLRTMILPEYECNRSFEEMVKAFPEMVMKNPNWLCRKSQCGMPYMQKGERVAIFELCSRKYASRLLKDPQSRKSGSFIPCKVAIYEKDGKVYLSRINLTLFTRLAGGNIAEVFMEDILPEQNAVITNFIK